MQYSGETRKIQIPFIWKIPCEVKLIFTFTPISSLLDNPPIADINKIEIEPLDNKILFKIFQTIITLYQKAYNFQPNKDFLNQNFFNLIPKDNTRLFIKRLIECLDLIRFYPEKSVEQLF